MGLLASSKSVNPMIVEKEPRLNCLIVTRLQVEVFCGVLIVNVTSINASLSYVELKQF